MDNVGGGYSSHGVRWPEREVNPSVPSKTEVQNKFFSARVSACCVKEKIFPLLNLLEPEFYI